MWRKLEIKNVGRIRKCVGEFEITMHKVLPYGKMKVKVYEASDKTFTAYTDIQIIRKFDGCPEGSVGFGKTEEQALEDCINWFNTIVDEDYPQKDYPEGLSKEHIEYTDPSDF